MQGNFLYGAFIMCSLCLGVCAYGSVEDRKSKAHFTMLSEVKTI